MTDDPAASAPAQPLYSRSVVLGLTIAAVFVALDQATKVLAEARLEPGRFVPLIGEHIGWQLVYNPGGAFGIGAPHWLFLGVTVIVVVVVLRALPRTPSKLTATAYGLLLSGAVGNVIDRLVRDGGPDAPAFGGGAVVDFVAWGTFPRFNVADAAITVGFVFLVLALWREERHHAPATGPAHEPDREGPLPVDEPDDDGASATDEPANGDLETDR